MWRTTLGPAGVIASLFLGAAAAHAAALSAHVPARDLGSMIVRVHSVDEAERTLYRRGYYDISLERSTLPYSFSACKRGVRYHVHMNYYGDLVQVDPIGACRSDDNESSYYSRRQPYDGFRFRRGY